jgi:hypothetical protein
VFLSAIRSAVYSLRLVLGTFCVKSIKTVKNFVFSWLYIREKTVLWLTFFFTIAVLEEQVGTDGRTDGRTLGYPR